MVADRHRLAAYHNKHCWRAFRGTNIDDLERPCTPKRWVLSDFFAILGCDAQWIFAEILYTGDRPRQPAYEIKLMLWRVSWALAQISCTYRQANWNWIPINWLTMKCTYFVVDFLRSRCADVQRRCNLVLLQLLTIYFPVKQLAVLHRILVYLLKIYCTSLLIPL